MKTIEQEIEELTAHLRANPTDADALYRRGTLCWRLDRRAAALSDLHAAAKLAPDGPAPAALSHLNFFIDLLNTEIYNP
ncbi:MAG: hypothetical protein K2M49_04640 [Muribaculaceae bacterium]|nr:hypothetical protein [Muribaculaceae bacterium]